MQNRHLLRKNYTGSLSWFIFWKLLLRYLSFCHKKKKIKKGFTKEWHDGQEIFRQVPSLENNGFPVILPVTFIDNYLERTTGVRKIEIKEPKIQGYEVRYVLGWIKWLFWNDYSFLHEKVHFCLKNAWLYAHIKHLSILMNTYLEVAFKVQRTFLLTAILGFNCTLNKENPGFTLE